MIQFAASTFEIHPKPGDSAGGSWKQRASEMYSPLKTSLFLIQENSRLIVLHTSHFITDYYRVSTLLRLSIAKALEIPIEQVFCFSSHNHCVPKLNAKDHTSFTPIPVDQLNADEELTDNGMELLRLSTQTAVRLRNQLQPVQVRYGNGKERRITHNRKGHRADGSTYLMREEDRLLMGEDFNGDIDDDAFVIGFFNDDKPVGFLTQFTGHPVTAYHCDRPIVYGEFPQVACDDLSTAFNGVPVGFLQGCAGDTNAKGLLSDLPVESSVRRAENYGHMLGQTFIQIASELKLSQRHDMNWAWRTITLPYMEVPALEELQMRLRAVENFLKRCDAGDSQNTQICDGLNFPRNMHVNSRIKLIEPTRQWLQWAMAFHTRNRLHEAPKGLTLSMTAIRIGDVGIVGMPGEPLLGIGRQIKRNTPLPITLPCGYMNEGQDSWAYIPDGPNCDDLDYSSSFYRYTQVMLPFRKPAGDLLATTAVQILGETLA